MTFPFESKNDFGMSALQNDFASVQLSEENEWKYQNSQRMFKNFKSKTPPSPADSGVVSDQSETSSNISSLFETATCRNNLGPLDSSNVPFHLNEAKKYGNALPGAYGSLSPFIGDNIWSNTSKYQPKNFANKNNALSSLWNTPDPKPSYDQIRSNEVYLNNVNKETSLRQNNAFNRSFSLQSGNEPASINGDNFSNKSLLDMSSMKNSLPNQFNDPFSSSQLEDAISFQNKKTQENYRQYISKHLNNLDVFRNNNENNFPTNNNSLRFSRSFSDPYSNQQQNLMLQNFNQTQNNNIASYMPSEDNYKTRDVNHSYKAEIYLKNVDEEFKKIYFTVRNYEIQGFFDGQLSYMVESQLLNFSRAHIFSRKLFLGGLPPDIDEEQIRNTFQRFGILQVDWPHKAESKSLFPPKGYAFLIFSNNTSLWRLIASCSFEDGKLFYKISSNSVQNKSVQIRPWRISDADYKFMEDNTVNYLDSRKTVFIGGVPRPLRAAELAIMMERQFGNVCYAGIDVDQDLKYPKGAGRVTFSDQTSYVAAISAKFVQLRIGEISKKIEIKAYYLDDQMCDICHGANCNNRHAQAFCANVICLKYYCDYCWKVRHAVHGRDTHKPITKEGTLSKSRSKCY